MIEAIFFDFDGVILESVDLKTQAFRRLFQAYPEKLPEILNYHEHHMGISRFKKFRHIHEVILGIPYNPATENLLGSEFKSIIFEEILKLPFVSGAREFLQTYGPLIDLHVVSGTPEDELKEICRRRGIDHFFSEIHGSPREKATIIQDILTRRGYDKNNVAFVGDAESDWKASLNVGIAFVARIANNSSLLTNVKPQVKDLTMLADVLSLHKLKVNHETK